MPAATSTRLTSQRARCTYEGEVWLSTKHYVLATPRHGAYLDLGDWQHFDFARAVFT